MNQIHLFWWNGNSCYKSVWILFIGARPSSQTCHGSDIDLNVFYLSTKTCFRLIWSSRPSIPCAWWPAKVHPVRLYLEMGGCVIHDPCRYFIPEAASWSRVRPVGNAGDWSVFLCILAPCINSNAFAQKRWVTFSLRGAALLLIHQLFRSVGRIVTFSAIGRSEDKWEYRRWVDAPRSEFSISNSSSCVLPILNAGIRMTPPSSNEQSIIAPGAFRRGSNIVVRASAVSRFDKQIVGLLVVSDRAAWHVIYLSPSLLKTTTS